MEEKKKSVRSQIHELEIGGHLTFPAERTSYLRAACTNIGFECDRKFSTSTNRVDRTITVTRIK